MTRQVWLSLACALSGCTLTLSHEPLDGAYGEGSSSAEGASLSGGFYGAAERTTPLAPSHLASSYDEPSAGISRSPFSTLTLHTRGMSDERGPGDAGAGL